MEVYAIICNGIEKLGSLIQSCIETHWVICLGIILLIIVVQYERHMDRIEKDGKL